MARQLLNKNSRTAKYVITTIVESVITVVDASF
jgi:hypothetical protein